MRVHRGFMGRSCPERVTRSRVCPQPGEKLGLAHVAGQAGDTQPPPKFTVISYLVHSSVENPASLLTRFGLQGTWCRFAFIFEP